MNLRKTYSFLTPLVFFLISAQEGFASYDVYSSAAERGYSYRSNLVDPGNLEDANPIRMLERMVEQQGYPLSNLYPGRWVAPTDSVVDNVRALLYDSSRLEHSDTLEADSTFESVRCRGGNADSVLFFLRGLQDAVPVGLARDDLIIARYLLYTDCRVALTHTADIFPSWEDFQNEDFTVQQEVRWRYLFAIRAYYSGNLGSARAHAMLVPDLEGDIISDAAQYLIVRTYVDSYSLGEAVDAFVEKHPDNVFFGTVFNLRRLVAVSDGDQSAYHQALIEGFESAFVPGAYWSEEARRDLVHELRAYHHDVEPSNYETSSPFLMLYRYFEALTDERFEIAGFREPLLAWAENSDGRSDLYPGLAAYIRMLVAFCDGDMDALLLLEMTEETLAVMLPDAMLLRARALSAVGREWEAALLWVELAQTTPVLNALPEAFHAAQRAGRMADFVRLDWRWSLDARTGTQERQPLLNEYRLPAGDYLALYPPIRPLLATQVQCHLTRAEAAAILSDPAVDPVVRFWVAEPQLRRTLYEGAFTEFAMLLESLQHDLPDLSDSPLGDDRSFALFANYLEARGLMESLLSGAAAPEALVDVGYFLYANHRPRPCMAEEDPASIIGATAPLEIFEQALELYQDREDHSLDEARALRIVLRCFQNYENRLNCISGARGDYSRDWRRERFERLHRFFPPDQRIAIWY